MKKYMLLFLLLFSFSAYAQNTLNNYKYVLVPEKFPFSKEENQYGLNTLAKSLLEEKGFAAYLDNPDIPQELAANKCNALRVEVLERKALFSTNLTLLLKDCQGNIVFKGKEGKSREKEFSTAYNLALRDAFASLKEVPYAYNGTVNTPQPSQPPVAAAQATTPSPATPSLAAAATIPAPAAAPLPAGTLYAQATATGYQLIDTTPKIVLSLFKTSVQDCFIADNGTAHGVVLKKGNDWYFEYYQGKQLVSEKLVIKF